MSQWQLNTDEYLKRLGLDQADFKKHLKLPRVSEVSQIVPLRQIRKVISMIPIDSEMLTHLVKRIPTLDGQMPFINSVVRQVVVNPRQLKIGQRFVYRENYQKMLENGFSDLFREFLGEWAGLGSLGAYFIFGTDDKKQYSMACYIPPIIEIHGKRPLIMDGIHRNYIGRQSGLPTINALIIKNVGVPFPCSAKSWTDIGVISLEQKPSKLEERYFDLNKSLFRNLKYLGIDG